MTQANSPSDSSIAPSPKIESAAAAAGSDAPPNKDLDPLRLMQSHGDVLQPSNTSNTTDGWLNDDGFKVKTTRNNDFTATTVLATKDSIPVEVLESAKDGSITHLFFGADGNPIGVNRTGANPDEPIEFKTPDGKDYSIYSRSTPFYDPNLQKVTEPWMRIAGPDGNVQTIKYNTGGTWQTFSVGPYTDNHRDLTNMQPPGGATPYIARYTQNSDGGYNVQYLQLDGKTPMLSMDSCRLMPIDHNNLMNTCMKKDGTVDYRDVLDYKTGRVTRYGPAEKVMPPKN